MTEIDVPDWVALLAEDRYSEAYYKGMTRTESMKAALTAALGAWVVPAGYLNKWDDGDETVSARPAHPEHGLAQPIYALRQEKPE